MSKAVGRILSGLNAETGYWGYETCCHSYWAFEWDRDSKAFIFEGSIGGYMKSDKHKADSTVTDSGRRSTGLAFMVRALGHRNYRLFFSGQSVSLIGTWMTR